MAVKMVKKGERNQGSEYSAITTIQEKSTCQDAIIYTSPLRHTGDRVLGKDQVLRKENLRRLRDYQ
jgi:hypothetical protein